MCLRGDETQNLVRYLTGLYVKIAYVAELHPYTTLDELNSLAYNVELQKSVKGKERPKDHQTEPTLFRNPHQIHQKQITHLRLKANTPTKTVTKPVDTRRCF